MNTRKHAPTSGEARTIVGWVLVGIAGLAIIFFTVQAVSLPLSHFPTPPRGQLGISASRHPSSGSPSTSGPSTGHPATSAAGRGRHGSHRPGVPSSIPAGGGQGGGGGGSTRPGQPSSTPSVPGHPSSSSTPPIVIIRPPLLPITIPILPPLPTLSIGLG